MIMIDIDIPHMQPSFRSRSPTPEERFDQPILHRIQPQIEQEMEAEQMRPTRMTSLALMRYEQEEAKRQASIRAVEQLQEQRWQQQEQRQRLQEQRQRQQEQRRQQQILAMLQEEATRAFGAAAEQEILPMPKEEELQAILQEEVAALSQEDAELYALEQEIQKLMEEESRPSSPPVRPVRRTRTHAISRLRPITGYDRSPRMRLRRIVYRR